MEFITIQSRAMQGWIKLHRQLKEHWLWKSEKRLKWWIDILITVNHCDSKVLIKGTLVEVKRGQSVRSLETWAKDWNCTKSAVKNFFTLLQKDSMIDTESIQITTRLTVLNYDSYQDQLYASETQKIRSENASETQGIHKQELKELKNDNNNNKVGFKKPTLEEVKEYCKDKGVDPIKWFNHYESNGWKVGKNPMKNWKAAIATWQKQTFTIQPKPVNDPDAERRAEIMASFEKQMSR